MVVKWPMVPITRSHFQALPIIYFSLGQNKTEQFSPFLPKEWREGAKEQKRTILTALKLGEGWSTCFIYFVQDCRLDFHRSLVSSVRRPTFYQSQKKIWNAEGRERERIENKESKEAEKNRSRHNLAGNKVRRHNEPNRSRRGQEVSYSGCLCKHFSMRFLGSV